PHSISIVPRTSSLPYPIYESGCRGIPPRPAFPDKVLEGRISPSPSLLLLQHDGELQLHVPLPYALDRPWRRRVVVPS
ncbi:hypothetical protein PENTCL1PPCAC_6223, partial [Pristionchus entomophagus]